MNIHFVCIDICLSQLKYSFEPSTHLFAVVPQMNYFSGSTRFFKKNENTVLRTSFGRLILKTDIKKKVSVARFVDRGVKK